MTMHIFDDTYLTTLDAAVAQLNATPGANYAGDEALLFRFIADASAMTHEFCNRSFVPYRQTRYYDAAGEHINGAWLSLDADLLAVEALTNGDDTVITSSQYVLRETNHAVKSAIQLKAMSGVIWTYSDDWEAAIEVDGIWGYHESYGAAWVDTLDTVQGAELSASATALTVTDADGTDARFHTRFQAGQVLRIDDEFLKIAAVDTDTNTLSVRRGQLGTDAAVHALGTAIYSYAVMRNIERAVTSLAIWLYRNKATQGDDIYVLGDGSKMINNQAPSNIRDTLNRYVRRF